MLHGGLFFLWLHLSVNHAYLVPGLGEGTGNTFIAIVQVFVVHRFRLFNEWIDDVGLPALVQLFFQEAKYLQALGIKGAAGDDGFATRGELINNRHIQVAVQGHGQRPGDGCGSHHQYVWQDFCLFPEPGTLCHTKAVLLIDDYHPQVLKLDHIFNDCVGTDQNVERSIQQTFMYGLPVGFFY